MAVKAFTLAALAALAYGHVEMVMPVPYDAAALSNGPLDPSGSDFPCKNPNYSNIGTMNTYSVGGKGQLQFIGTAVHGGGSCQVSVTYDNPPTKNSVWKVIKSIEGGCPSRNEPGNIPGDDPNYPIPDTYDFEIPTIPEGEATLAWTWFNKIGQREMYMNCAPIKITGSGGSAEYYNSLPDMFKANINGVSDGCTTSEGSDTQFPDAGITVEQNDKGAFGPPGSCPSSKGNHQPAPTQGGGDAPPAPTPTKPAAEPPAPTSVPGGVFVPAPTQAPADPVPAPANPGSGSGGAQSGACTQEGAFNCIGGSSFQQCASGSWTPATNLAAGTKCAPGVSNNFIIEAA